MTITTNLSISYLQHAKFQIIHKWPWYGGGGQVCTHSGILCRTWFESYWLAFQSLPDCIGSPWNNPMGFSSHIFSPLGDISLFLRIHCFTARNKLNEQNIQKKKRPCRTNCVLSMPWIRDLSWGIEFNSNIFTEKLLLSQKPYVTKSEAAVSHNVLYFQQLSTKLLC